jgi:hypothetical protein
MKNAAYLFTILLAFVMMIPAVGYSQGRDLKVGTGLAFLGSGDINVLKFEAEYTKRINRHFSTSLSMNFGHGVSESYFSSSAPQQVSTVAHIDPNIFFSPFGNHKAFNLKLGTGASFMYANDVWMSSYSSGGPMGGVATYDFDRRFTVGASMIVEPEVRVGRSLFSVKGIIQPYLNGDISSGVYLKFGRML